MKALIHRRFGPPSVVELAEYDRLDPSATELLIKVRASAVNTGDWRIRAAAFPGILAIPGRLMFGLTRPRNPRLGSEFAGDVVAVGRNVTGFTPRDAVYGIKPGAGTSAEWIAIADDAAVAPIPDGLTYAQAAALPFGGLCALVFLHEYARLAAGQRLLIVGATGGVGCYAVQIAKALGAHVTGVAGADSQALLESLGADTALDYTRADPYSGADPFDVIFDTIGVLSPRQARALMTARGLFLPLNYGLREIGAALINPLRHRKIRLAVNPDRAEDLRRLSAMVSAGAVRPVIAQIYPLSEAVAAHAHVESRHKHGAIVLAVDTPEALPPSSQR
ncbi:MAG: NAD(P)-dependent alcohol dehydrogenase [Pseudomonadota bacterium]